MKKDGEPDDPMLLVGVRDLPAMTAEEEREMHRCLVDEYVRMGFTDAAILDLFRNPFYRATHETYRTKGPGYVNDLLASVRAAWQPKKGG